ncbi:MAG: hypothetical protein HOV68_13265 [Streptomycetaceae bacterium]|nr:hypothetical protein [Streptomycetaceae bacterium]
MSVSAGPAVLSARLFVRAVVPGGKGCGGGVVVGILQALTKRGVDVADVDRRTGGTHDELEWPVPWSALPKRQRRRRLVVAVAVMLLWIAAFVVYLIVLG